MRWVGALDKDIACGTLEWNKTDGVSVFVLPVNRLVFSN
jgi:hypothetical protein